MDFTVNMFYVVLFCLFEVLFGILALSFLANRPLLAANREDNPTRKHLSTKLEIKSKQLLSFFSPNFTLNHSHAAPGRNIPIPMGGA